MKETFYFSHDYYAREDEKIIKLISTHGLEGYGVFWCIVEMLYENNGCIEGDCNAIAFSIRLNKAEMIESVIKDFGLFIISNNKIISKSCLARLRKRKGKSEKARQSAFFRWNKPKKRNANAMRTQCERNAIKESKVKERKYILSEASSDEIPNLLKDKNKHIQIIGLYARAKGIEFENKKHQQEFIKRNVRAGNSLAGNNMNKIIQTMKYLKESADFKWNLESVGKYVEENLRELAQKTLSVKDEKKYLDLINKKII
jgi:uncharacterized protein YdaU (DUF1376 family)